MDRPQEGIPAETPTDDEPTAGAQQPSADQESSDEPCHVPFPSVPSRNDGNRIDSAAAETVDLDRPGWRTRARRLQINPIESAPMEDAPIGSQNMNPTRRLIFHRFDPKVAGQKSPHFEIEAPPVEPQDGEGEPLIELSEADVVTDPIDAGDIENDIDVSVDVDSQGHPDAVDLTTRHRNHSRRGDPVRHGLVMIATVVAMMAAARFVLPGIVEEIRYAQHRGQLRAEFEVAGEGLKNVSLDTLSKAYQMVNDAAGPSVVHIDIHRQTRESVAHSDIPGAPTILVSDQGSGVVVDADGYVLTNRHVIEASDGISVTLSDGRRVDAVVIGTDEMTDLAVLKVNADQLIPIPWGDSERIRVGSPVWAIGSPFGLDRTVTFGILSGKHRVVRAKDRYQDFMQSDVAVNPGNSGGPLVDSHGTLIGINTAIVGDTYQGVSFAIPSGIAKKIYMELREKGSVQRGWLGVSLAEVPNDMLPTGDHRVRGAMITALADRNSGAARAGLRPGDLVISLDQERVRDVDHLMQMIGNAMAGTGIKLSVLRESREMEFDVLLGRRPELRTR
ncbi:MAG: trypsin-like peptidase domain-containing protein [Planctomycetales bacterium]|nr:trypsin-like peptidase domain-containing protein [Planctomycetales bacterium]